MRLLLTMTAASVLAMFIITVSPPAYANPALSEWSDLNDYDQDVCVQRARATFAGDGWQNVQLSGYSISADRGPLSGVIVCLGYGASLTQSVAVVVVAGGDGNAAADEGSRLKRQMFGK
jgi:hypothetical protein